MKVKSIVIDGFKSYAHRQELSNLDPHFNAITGLNGSGKSNVFDAICFVMGLRNVAKVRVERQEELIFKNGKAGIQRASVTIEFDNNDPATAPTNYPPHEFPTITITRQIDTGLRQRFFFNGRLCDQDRIKEFFIQASLNIENPHFLVQQGQIHRLVGMKPADILGFIEEAAGTLIFDHSRRKSELQMRSKEKRMQEINTSLDTEIGPRLRSIEEQDKEYSKFEEVSENLEQLRNFRFALDFYKSKNHASEATDRLHTVSDRLRQLKQNLLDLEAEMVAKAAAIERSEEDQKAPREELEKHSSEHQGLKKDIVQHKTQCTQQKKQATALQNELKKLEDELKKATDDSERFHSQSDATLNKYKDLEDQVESTERKIEDLKQAVRLCNSGVQAGAAGVSLEEEKAILERDRIKLEGNRKQKQQQANHLENEIRELTERQQDMQSRNSAQEKELARLRTQLQKAEAEFKPYEESAQRFKVVRNTFGQHQQRYQDLQLSISRDYPLLTPLKFQPIQGWDNMEQMIKGKLGELVRVSDPSFSYAISIGAGQSLLRVVISSAEAAQVLIERGRLSQRTSFFPLNAAAAGGAIDSNRVEMARGIAKEMGPDCYAELASSLIETISLQDNQNNNNQQQQQNQNNNNNNNNNFEQQQLQNLIDRVFGTFMVCSSTEVARKIAFDQRCRIKAVSLDGDVVEPSGLMSGGSKAQQQDLLSEFARGSAKIQQCNQAAREVYNMKTEMAQLVKEQQTADRLQNAVDELQGKVEMLEHSAQSSDFGRVQKNLEAAKQKRDDCKKFVEGEFVLKHKEIADRLAEIGRDEKLDSKDQAKQLEAELKQEQAKLVRLAKDVQGGQQAHSKEEARKDQLRAKVDAIKSSLDDKKADLQTAKDEEAKLTEELQALEKKLNEANALVKNAKQRHDALCEQYAQLTKEMEALQEDKSEYQRTIEKTQTEHNEAERASKEANEQCNLFQKEQKAKHPWLNAEIQKTLGDLDGNYYFRDETRTEATLKKHKEFEELFQSLSKKVNRRARTMLEQWSEEHKKLVDQRQILSDDKTSIVDSIKKVEHEKWSALDDVVKRVSEHFSSLFHTCLDYATCRLAEQRDPESKRLLGLEVKVAFNGKEKNSLTELSGGQRSLLALCLILAILRVHRAPVYILDEVDAALDPSHTQNLGLMLKTHFADAQFLLVSLKDGMFSSANVVYEVRNTQGFSEVSRKEIRRK